MSLSAEKIHYPFDIGVQALKTHFFEKHNFLNLRASLAIASALYLQFPEQMQMNGLDKSIVMLDWFTPFQIAVNEAADIGISARLARGRCTHDAFQPLLELENRTMQDLTSHRDRFLHQYPEKTALVDSFIHDFLLLSHNRTTFNPFSYKTYLELDNGMFTAVNSALVLPGVTESAGIPMEDPAHTLDDLIEKYHLFIVDSNPQLDIQCNNDARKLLALHCVEMCLKINDDWKGNSLDSILGIPNFTVWAKSFGREMASQKLKELRRNYRNTAAAGTIDPWIVHAAELLFSVTSSLKSRNALRKTDNLHERDISLLVGNGRISTTLRHELTKVIYSIFQRPVTSRYNTVDYPQV